MNTNEIDIKQLVQFCEIELGEHPSNYYKKYLNQIINFLKYGEKYEQILYKVKDIISSHSLIWLEKKIMELEQEHLKSIKKTIKFTIEAPTKHYLVKAISDFEMFWDNYNGIKGNCAKYSYKGD